MISVPQVVRNKARNVGATSWVDELPALVSDLERRWDMTVGAPYEEGTEAFVAQVALEDGTLAVLKLCIPRERMDAAELEARVLRLVDGDGCARLLRDDLSVGALLLERLGPSMHSLRLPIEERHERLCEAAVKLWRPAPDAGLPTGAEKGHWLIDHVTRAWEELDRPCSERAVAYAIECAERRIAAHDDERAVLVHGDVHEWNALAVGDGTFKLVDPDGLFAEPEYDLGIIMREDPTEGELRARARWLAARTGLDATAIWEWGAIERVSTGLFGVADQLQPVANEMLAAADRISVHPAPL